MAQAIPVKPTMFVQTPFTYSVTSHVSQFHLNVCTQIEAGSTNGRKQVVWDDVRKYFLLHKAAILNNSLDSFKHWNVKYVIKVK